MTIASRKILTGILIANLSACSLVGKTDINALKQTAINDASDEPEDLKLDYMKCYGMDHPYKKQCYDILSKYSEKRKHAVSWVYTTSFDKEMELQGFAVFLRHKGKICNRLTGNPELDHKTKTYVVTCDNNGLYKISFAKRKLFWELVG